MALSHLKNDQSTVTNTQTMSISHLKNDQSTTGNNRSMSISQLANYIKIENFRTEKFRQKTSDKKLLDPFSGISDKLFLHNTKMSV